MKKLFKKYKFKSDATERILKTFVQAALGYIAVNIALVDFGSGKEAAKSALIGLLVAAAAAGLSAVMNLEKKDKTVFEETPEDEFITEDEK